MPRAVRLDDPNSNQEFLRAFCVTLERQISFERQIFEGKLETDRHVQEYVQHEIETQKHRTAPLSGFRVTNLRIEVFEVCCERERKGLAVAGRCRGREN